MTHFPRPVDSARFDYPPVHDDEMPSLTFNPRPEEIRDSIASQNNGNNTGYFEIFKTYICEISKNITNFFIQLFTCKNQQDPINDSTQEFLDPQLQNPEAEDLKLSETPQNLQLILYPTTDNLLFNIAHPPSIDPLIPTISQVFEFVIPTDHEKVTSSALIALNTQEEKTDEGTDVPNYEDTSSIIAYLPERNITTYSPHAMPSQPNVTSVNLISTLVGGLVNRQERYQQQGHAYVQYMANQYGFFDNEEDEVIDFEFAPTAISDNNVENNSIVIEELKEL